MLSLQIFTDSTESTLLADYTSRIHPPYGGGMIFSTNEHGFASLNIPLVPMSLEESFLVYDWPGTPHMVVTDDGANTVWEGRLEDIGIIPSGVSMAGMGYWRSMRDVPYTALWSDDNYDRWQVLDERAVSNNRKDRFEFDTNNRLYITAKKGETHGAFVGRLGYLIPDDSSRKISRVEFDYECLGNSTNWAFGLQSAIATTFDSTWSTLSTIWSQASSGSLQSGSQAITLGTPREALGFYMFRSAGSSVLTAETGDYYLKITNLRVTTDDGTVYADEIIDDLVSHVNGINSDQLDSSTVLVESPAVDLQYEIYEDAYPADIATYLADKHSYEVGIWEGQKLHFRDKGSAARNWYIDVTQILQLERSLDPIKNSAYARYRGGSGETLRTAVANDEASQTRFGLVRRGYVDAQTTSATEAGTERDTFLADRKNLSIRADIEFNRLYDESGAEYPLWEIRSGDTVTMRNLSPTLPTDIDNIRTFYAAETEYDTVSNRISIAPGDPVPTLVTLISSVVQNNVQIPLQQQRRRRVN